MENKKEKFNTILFIILFSILIFIYKNLIVEAVVNNSLDFQWSPSKLVADGINHYEYMLDGNREKIIGSQFGEYLHGTYVLYYPLTLLSWYQAKIVWLIINIFLVVLLPYLICKKFLIDTNKTLLIIFFFAACNVTKVNLIIGQYSLFIMFFLCLPYLYKSNIAFILSGISYFKYSIGYVLLFNFLISKKIKKIIFSFIPVFVGVIIYSYLTNTNIFITFFQPLELAIESQLINHQGQAIMPKNVFIFSIFEFLNFNNFKIKPILFIILSILLNFLIVIKIHNINDDLLKLSCLCLSCLIFFPHYPHNYILVLPLLIHSIKNFDFFYSKINFLFSVYFLHFFRLVEIYIPKIFKNNFDLIEFFVSYINILFLLIILIININKKKII